jgi:hypothetical protein
MMAAVNSTWDTKSDESVESSVTVTRPLPKASRRPLECLRASDTDTDSLARSDIPILWSSDVMARMPARDGDAVTSILLLR